MRYILSGEITLPVTVIAEAPEDIGKSELFELADAAFGDVKILSGKKSISIDSLTGTFGAAENPPEWLTVCEADG